MTGGALEENLNSLQLKEGIDYFHFNWHRWRQKEPCSFNRVQRGMQRTEAQAGDNRWTEHWDGDNTKTKNRQGYNVLEKCGKECEKYKFYLYNLLICKSQPWFLRITPNNHYSSLGNGDIKEHRSEANFKCSVSSFQICGAQKLKTASACWLWACGQ